MRIAFIDDSQDFLDLCKIKVTHHNLISKNQIDAMYFSDAESFRELLDNQGQVFEYAVIDLMMPKVNGFDLAEELKKNYPEMKEIICSDSILPSESLKSFVSKRAFEIENIIERFLSLKTFRNFLEIGIRKSEFEAGIVYG